MAKLTRSVDRTVAQMVGGPGDMMDRVADTHTTTHTSHTGVNRSNLRISVECSDRTETQSLLVEQCPVPAVVHHQH